MRNPTFIAALCFVAGIGVLQPTVAAAMTPRSAALTSSGLNSVSVFTYQDSTEGWITFRLRDSAGLGANVSQCDVTSGGARVDCDTYRLRPMNYRGGEWKIRQTPGGWLIRIYVGYYSASAKYCWESRAGDRSGVQIAILTGRERLVVKRTHMYTLRCDGVAAKASGPSVLTTRAGQSSLPFSVTADVVDRRRAVAEIERCFYDVELDETTNCSTDPTTAVARRTSSGWMIKRAVSLNNVSVSECRDYQRERPRLRYEMTFLDGNGEVLGETSWSFRLTCQG